MKFNQTKKNRGASTSVSVSYILYTHYQMRCYSKNPFLKTGPLCVSEPATCASLATSL